MGRVKLRVGVRVRGSCSKPATPAVSSVGRRASSRPPAEALRDARGISKRGAPRVRVRVRVRVMVRVRVGVGVRVRVRFRHVEARRAQWPGRARHRRRQGRGKIELCARARARTAAGGGDGTEPTTTSAAAAACCRAGGFPRSGRVLLGARDCRRLGRHCRRRRRTLVGTRCLPRHAHLVEKELGACQQRRAQCRLPGRLTHALILVVVLLLLLLLLLLRRRPPASLVLLLTAAAVREVQRRGST